jgi:hypothetical protein
MLEKKKTGKFAQMVGSLSARGSLEGLFFEIIIAIEHGKLSLELSSYLVTLLLID